jgi:adenosine deaminase
MGEGGTGTASGTKVGERVTDGAEASVSYPKIELHVHLEGTVRGGTLLQIARRNGTALPADSVEGLAELYEFRDFAHFIKTWVLTTGALRTEQDFRQVVADYAAEAAAHGALTALGADRIRHGIRAVDDTGLVRELADRGIVLDVCPISNLRTGVVASLAEHPLPDLVAAGVRCSVSTDDPAMFGTDLGTEYRAAVRLGISPQAIYQAGLRGALCDEETRAALGRAGEACDWAAVAAAERAISEPEGLKGAPEASGKTQ